MDVAPIQTSLLDSLEPQLADLTHIRRRQLDERSWVDTLPGFLSGGRGLLDELLDQIRWNEPTRTMYGERLVQPRLSSWLDADGLHAWPVLEQIAAALSGRYGRDFDSAALNLYRHGRDSVAWHSDRDGRVKFEPLVAIVTLGAPRRFLMRPVGGGASVCFAPGSGDLLVMGGACQHLWQHSVPKCRAAQPRLSVSFRHSS